MAVILRSEKGSELTHSELDQNFDDLRKGVGARVPKGRDDGIRIEAAFGWHDLRGRLFVPDQTDPNAPVYSPFVGNIQQYLFVEDTEIQVGFHIPHDYVMGSDLFMHVHWSHNSSLVTGGSVTWGFELTYAKGHNQAAFTAPVLVTEVQTASTTALQHMVCEAPISISGGSANLLDTDDLEVDGLVFGRIYLVSNDLVVSSGLPPGVFLHESDLHYQSTNVATKNRTPDFWT